MQLKLGAAGPRGGHHHDHHHDPGLTGHQGEHGAGQAAKLGIVKLGKVAGKVRISYIGPVMTPEKSPPISKL